ncbi:MAG TPA: helix-turn-helix domain-containing protein [Patescibacteria group bacterium]|nr:helix-turn-helix domain-containing protein [Patescibacteria group bacterium]
MLLTNLLQKIGLSEKEILVYSALVELGPQPVRVIAEKSGVNRGTCYDILESLQEQGLVTFFEKDKHQYFSPEPPEKLLKVLEHKKSALDLVSAEVEANLPKLKSLFEKEGGRPLVKLYEGESGIRQILQDVLDTLSEEQQNCYYVYSASGLRQNVFEAMPDFTKKRIARNIRVMTLAIGEGGGLVGLDERKWLKATSDVHATYELIYAGKVAHISLHESSASTMGVVIQSRAIYETQKLIFMANWEAIK